MPDYISNYLNAISKYPGTDVYANNIKQCWNDIALANANNDIKSLDVAYEALSNEATKCEAFLKHHKVRKYN